jgi:crossover junction endodeoxyribonuclease RuvC
MRKSAWRDDGGGPARARSTPAVPAAPAAPGSKPSSPPGSGSSESAVRILGVDPGSTVTGFGVVERRGGGVFHVAHGTLRTPRGAALADRLAAIQIGLARAIAEHRPEVVVVERIFAGRSARSARVLGHARGVALVTAARAGLSVLAYTAPEITLAVVGTGAAEKRQVQAMVSRLLGLAVPPAFDAADALAAALCHAHRGPLAALVATASQRGRARGGAGTGRLVVRRAR